MRYGIIDLGSNTIRLAVYHKSQSGISCLFTKKEFAHAVTYRQQDSITQEGIEVINQALCALSRYAMLFDLKNLWCFATASLRGAANKSEVLSSIAAATGLDVRVLSEKQEAALGVKGFVSMHKASDALIIDLGGGSLEISLLHGKKTCHTASLPVGSVLTGQQHVSGILPTNDEIMRIISEVHAALCGVDWLHGCGAPAAYAMGGSARALCRIHRALSGADTPLEAYNVRTDTLERLQTWLLSKKLESIRLIDRHCPGRLFSALPGIVILRQLMEISGVPELRLCTAGLREGYLLHMLDAL